MFEDSFLNRIKKRARSNELCIAIGSRFAGENSLPTLGKLIAEKFDVIHQIKHDLDWFTGWNDFVDLAEGFVERRVLNGYILELVAKAPIDVEHRCLASIPISNFVDVTMDRRFSAALVEGGKSPIFHGCLKGSMGSWKQSIPENPNVFSAFLDLEEQAPWHGLHQQLTINEQNRIQIENMMEMVRNKDLLLLGFTPHEAEAILHLPYLAQAADKIVNTEDPTNDYRYWSKRGTYLAEYDTDKVIE